MPATWSATVSGDPDLTEFKRLVQERLPNAWCLVAHSADGNGHILEIEYENSRVVIMHIPSSPDTWIIEQTTHEPGTDSLVRNSYTRNDARELVLEDTFDWLGAS